MHVSRDGDSRLSPHGAFMVFRPPLAAVVVRVDRETLRLRASDVARAVTRNTVVVVASAPGYPHGVMDDVEGIAEVTPKSYSNPFDPHHGRVERTGMSSETPVSGRRWHEGVASAATLTRAWVASCCRLHDAQGLMCPPWTSLCGA